MHKDHNMVLMLLLSDIYVDFIIDEHNTYV